MSQVIAVVSGKGGTGKTSFVSLTGAALSQLGKKTLVLDCDIGLRNLDLYLGLSVTPRFAVGEKIGLSFP